MADGWMPIESAPKDGTRILLWPHMLAAHWEFGDEAWLIMHVHLNEDRTISDGPGAELFYCLYANAHGVEPTHWQPLPPPPQPEVAPMFEGHSHLGPDAETAAKPRSSEAHRPAAPTKEPNHG